jgi:hypothetical protein
MCRYPCMGSRELIDGVGGLDNEVGPKVAVLQTPFEL